MSKALNDFHRAKSLLADSGFTLNQAHEMLTMRQDLRDKFAMAALPEAMGRYQMVAAAVEYSYKVADEMLARRVA